MPETTLDLSALNDSELNERYNLTGLKIKQLQEEAELIRLEIARRETLKKGGTFTLEAIERMRSFFIENATSERPKNCIRTMNIGLRILFDDPNQPIANTVHDTMRKFQESGRAGPLCINHFKDANGRMTTGIRRPETLMENLLEIMLELSENKIGWIVFGLSIMDGYHSVTLTLDNNNPEEPHIYWSDQWKSRKGWKEFSREGLDEEVTRLTKKWWDKMDPQKKPRTQVTLWRLLPR